MIAFGGDTRGSVAIIFGLTTFVLFAMIGIAVDYARFLNARSLTIAASDAAVIAGARTLQTNGGNQAEALKVAQTYYQQSTKNRITLVPGSDTIGFAVTDNATAVVSNGNAQVPTPFMHLAFLGTAMKSLQLLRSNGLDYSKAKFGLDNLEVGLMLDITGSMAGTKLTQLKSAATNLVNILLAPSTTVGKVKMGIVPFSEDVRLPNPLLGSVFSAATGKPSLTTTPCVVERPGSEQATDAAPGIGQFFMVHTDQVISGRGRNQTISYQPKCTVASSAELLPLTSTKQDLLDKISGLAATGGTAGHLGTEWAWYMLSPNWASVWGTSSAAAPYGTDKLRKVAILMTDGVFNQQYDANGFGVDYLDSPPLNPSCPDAINGCSSTQALAICQGMKDKDIEVYTIGFQLAGNQLAINTLSQCATDANHFYNSATGDALSAAFQDIALKIMNLYLSQ